MKLNGTGKRKWWFTILAPPEILSVVDAAAGLVQLINGEVGDVRPVPGSASVLCPDEGRTGSGCQSLHSISTLNFGCLEV